MRPFDPAAGSNLDILGIDHGIPRRRREKDGVYRWRMVERIRSPALVGSSAAIVAAAEDVLPASATPQLSDWRVLPRSRPGRVYMVIHEPRWRRWLVVPAWLNRRRVRAAVTAQLAAGVVLRVRSER